jgi:hypothetical protein
MMGTVDPNNRSGTTLRPELAGFTSVNSTRWQYPCWTALTRVDCDRTIGY